MGERVFELIMAENMRQSGAIELIASENFVSNDIMLAVGSPLTNKYTEGYPAERTSGNIRCCPGTPLIRSVNCSVMSLSHITHNARCSNPSIRRTTEKPSPPTISEISL